MVEVARVAVLMDEPQDCVPLAIDEQAGISFRRKLQTHFFRKKVAISK